VPPHNCSDFSVSGGDRSCPAASQETISVDRRHCTVFGLFFGNSFRISGDEIDIPAAAPSHTMENSFFDYGQDFGDGGAKSTPEKNFSWP